MLKTAMCKIFVSTWSLRRDLVPFLYKWLQPCLGCRALQTADRYCAAAAAGFFGLLGGMPRPGDGKTPATPGQTSSVHGAQLK